EAAIRRQGPRAVSGAAARRGAAAPARNRRAAGLSVEVRLNGEVTMRVWLVLLAIVAVAPLTAAAQHAGHQHTPGAPADGHLRAQACLDEFDAVVGDGRGFGMAFAADQHGYPGPVHVLELKDRLALTPEQETRVRALMHAMFTESRPKSARLL